MSSLPLSTQQDGYLHRSFELIRDNLSSMCPQCDIAKLIDTTTSQVADEKFFRFIDCYYQEKDAIQVLVKRAAAKSSNNSEICLIVFMFEKVGHLPNNILLDHFNLQENNVHIRFNRQSPVPAMYAEICTPCDVLEEELIKNLDSLRTFMISHKKYLKDKANELNLLAYRAHAIKLFRYKRRAI